MDVTTNHLKLSYEHGGFEQAGCGEMPRASQLNSCATFRNGWCLSASI